jgi:hypothetical protein
MGDQGAAVDEYEEIDDEDDDQDKAADPDVRPEAHVGPVLGEVGRRDVSGLVVVVMHVTSLEQMRRHAAAIRDLFC